MIGWGPQTYAPLHDHPIGGCLAKVVTGPGVVETHYWKPNNILNQRVNPKTLEVFHPNLYEDGRTKLYKCVEENNSDGCRIKNQTMAWITRLNEYHMTETNLQVMYQEGYDYMHSVINPHRDGTLTLHHYFGDYHISFWEQV